MLKVETRLSIPFPSSSRERTQRQHSMSSRLPLYITLAPPSLASLLLCNSIRGFVHPASHGARGRWHEAWQWRGEGAGRCGPNSYREDGSGVFRRCMCSPLVPKGVPVANEATAEPYCLEHKVPSCTPPILGTGALGTRRQSAPALCGQGGACVTQGLPFWVAGACCAA